jgi:hypothetical protein
LNFVLRQTSMAILVKYECDFNDIQNIDVRTLFRSIRSQLFELIQPKVFHRTTKK